MGRLGTAPSLFSAALQHAAMLNDEPTTRLDAENVPFVRLWLCCGTKTSSFMRPYG